MSRLAILPQYLLPKRLLTDTLGKLASLEGGRLTTAVIRRFIRRYRVDMSQALDPDPASYKTFQDFFTRALAPGARPIDEAPFVSPVDGTISQFGAIGQGRIFQAKGHDYSATALLGGDAALAAQFDNGSFATLYLSPANYHRVHMPCAGRLTRMVYVPGTLFSVNQTAARYVPGLFARNERLVCVFESDNGPFVLVLVGAAVVGAIATVWHGAVNQPRPGEVREWLYAENPVLLEKGQEMGRFYLGSTVVALFPQGCVDFNPQWAPGGAIRMGECMGQAAR